MACANRSVLFGIFFFRAERKSTYKGIDIYKMYSFFALFFLRKEKRHKRKTSSRIFIPIGSSRAAFSQARKLLGTADGRVCAIRDFGQPRAASQRNLMKRYRAVVCSYGLMWTLPFASFRRTFGANATNYVRGAKRYVMKNLH